MSVLRSFGQPYRVVENRIIDRMEWLSERLFNPVRIFAFNPGKLRASRPWAEVFFPVGETGASRGKREDIFSREDAEARRNWSTGSNLELRKSGIARTVEV